MKVSVLQTQDSKSPLFSRFFSSKHSLKAVPLFAPAVLGLALPAPDAAPVPVPVPARLPAAIPALEAELLERQISSNGGK